MDKGILTKINDAAKIFALKLEDIEKDVLLKLKDVEKLVDSYNEQILDLKNQQKENDKKLQVKIDRVAEELKTQEKITKQINEELGKQSNITKDIEKIKLSNAEALRISEIAKNQSLDELTKQRKTSLETKSKKEEQERLHNANIERSKKFDAEFERLNMREAELNRNKAKYEKDKIDFDSKQASLDLRLKNIEHIEKQLKVKNAS